MSTNEHGAMSVQDIIDGISEGRFKAKKKQKMKLKKVGIERADIPVELSSPETVGLFGLEHKMKAPWSIDQMVERMTPKEEVDEAMRFEKGHKPSKEAQEVLKKLNHHLRQQGIHYKAGKKEAKTGTVSKEHHYGFLTHADQASNHKAWLRSVGYTDDGKGTLRKGGEGCAKEGAAMPPPDQQQAPLPQKLPPLDLDQYKRNSDEVKSRKFLQRADFKKNKKGK